MMDDNYNPEEHDENLYSSEGREEFVDGGEISAEEDAFMKGYDDAEDEDESDEESDDESDDESNNSEDIDEEYLNN